MCCCAWCVHMCVCVCSGGEMGVGVGVWGGGLGGSAAGERRAAHGAAGTRRTSWFTAHPQKRQQQLTHSHSWYSMGRPVALRASRMATKRSSRSSWV